MSAAAVSSPPRRRIIREITYSRDFGLSEAEIVNEKTGAKEKVWRIENVLMQRADAPNRNHRVYPRNVLEREVARLSPLAPIGAMMAQADHPPQGASDKIREVVLVWKNLGMNEAGEVRGGGTFAMTGAGRDVIEVLKAGGQVGISSRGTGSVKRESRDGQDVDVVDEDFRLMTFDVVVGPSVPDAGIPASSFVEERYSADEAIEGEPISEMGTGSYTVKVTSNHSAESRPGRKVTMSEAKDGAGATSAAKAESFFPDAVRGTLTAAEWEKVESKWRESMKVSDVDIAAKVNAQVEAILPEHRSKIEKGEQAAETLTKVAAAFSGLHDTLANLGLLKGEAFCAKGKGKDEEDEMEAVKKAEAEAAKANAEAEKAKGDAEAAKTEAARLGIENFLLESLQGNADAKRIIAQVRIRAPKDLEGAKKAITEAVDFIADCRKAAGGETVEPKVEVTSGDEAEMAEGQKVIPIRKGRVPTGKAPSGLSEDDVMSGANGRTKAGFTSLEERKILSLIGD